MSANSQLDNMVSVGTFHLPPLRPEGEEHGFLEMGKEGPMPGQRREPMDATTLAEFARAIRFVFMLRTGRLVAGEFFSFMVFPFRWSFVGDWKEAPDMVLQPCEFAFVFRHPDSFTHFVVAKDGQTSVDGRFVGLEHQPFARQIFQDCNRELFFVQWNPSHQIRERFPLFQIPVGAIRCSFRKRQAHADGRTEDKRLHQHRMRTLHNGYKSRGRSQQTERLDYERPKRAPRTHHGVVPQRAIQVCFELEEFAGKGLSVHSRPHKVLATSRSCFSDRPNRRTTLFPLRLTGRSSRRVVPYARWVWVSRLVLSVAVELALLAWGTSCVVRRIRILLSFSRANCVRREGASHRRRGDQSSR